MDRKRYRKRKKLKAYLARAGIVLALAAILFLVVCGWLYLHGLFTKDKSEIKQTGNLTIGSNKENETVPNNKNDDKIPTPTPTPIPHNNTYIDGSITSAGLSGKCVVLDAGHGGNDQGTSSGDILEKDINLAVALKIKPILESYGIKVILTRSSDEYITLEDRAGMANQSGADVFVSIHCNYYEKDAAVAGLECYYCPGQTAGQEYAESIISAAQKESEIAVRNAKPEDYYVLLNTAMPAVLVEIGYMSNDDECGKLTEDSYQDLIAAKIAEGVMKKLAEA